MSTDRTRTKSRPARAADIEAFFGEKVPVSVRARVLEVDGNIVGVAGYYLYGGFAVVFSDMKGDLPRMTIWREAKALMEELKLPAICVAESGSGRLLERLGWEFSGTSESGDIYKWQH